MQVFYFTLSNKEYKPGEVYQRKYVKVIAENKEVATDAYLWLHPLGYSGIFAEGNFKPNSTRQWIETIKQRRTDG